MFTLWGPAARPWGATVVPPARQIGKRPQHGPGEQNYALEAALLTFRPATRAGFHHLVGKLWFLALRRRSQRSKRTWEWFEHLLTVFPLPKPIIHQRWFGART
jgi:hypothetical protein